MNYYKWNKLIARDIFDYKYGQQVFIYRSKEDLIALYRKVIGKPEDSDDDIWSNFIGAINNPNINLNEYPSVPLEYSFCERVNYLCQKSFINNDHLEYPYYIAYLIFLCFPLAEIEGNVTYRNLEDFLSNLVQFPISIRTETIRSISNEIPDNNEFNVWKRLENWSLRDERRGYFKDEVSSFRNHYVQRIKNQSLCTLTKADYDYLPIFFRAAHLAYGGQYFIEDYKYAIINKYNRNSILNRNRIEKLRNNASEIEPFVEQIAEFHKQWDGLYEESEESRRRKTHHIPLLLELICDENDNVDISSFRVRYPDFGDNERIELDNGGMIELERDGWSTSIVKENIDISRNYSYRSKDQRIVFGYSPEEEYIFFQNIESLSTDVYVNQGHLLSPYKANFILFKDNQNNREHLIPWIQQSGWYMQFDRGNIPNGYILYCFKDINIETIPRNLSTYFSRGINKFQINIIGGLPLNNHYLNDVFPIIKCDSLSPNTQIYLCHNGENYECAFKQISRENQIIDYWWEIPNQDEIRNANQYDSEIIVENSIVKRIVFVSAVQRENIDIPATQISPHVSLKDNRLVSNENNEEYLDDDEDAPQTFNENLLELEKEGEYNSTQFGNSLINWLYYKGKCTKNELTQVIETLYQCEYGREYNNKYLTNKIKWLCKAGFIQYKERTIYALSPRLIISPRNSGNNKLILVGCRSHKLIELLKAHADSSVNNNRDFVSLCFENQKDNYFCKTFPQVVSFETTGTGDNNGGIDNAIDVARRCNISVDNCKTFVKSLYSNLSQIDDVIRINRWAPTEERQYTLNMFNISELRYESIQNLKEQWVENAIYGNKYRLVRRQYSISEFHTYILDMELRQETLVDDTEAAKLFISYYYCTNISEALEGCRMGVFKTDGNDLYIKFPLMMPQIYSQYYIMLTGIIPSVEDIQGTKYYHYYLPERGQWQAIAEKLRFWTSNF